MVGGSGRCLLSDAPAPNETTLQRGMHPVLYPPIDVSLRECIWNSQHWLCTIYIPEGRHDPDDDRHSNWHKLRPPPHPKKRPPKPVKIAARASLPQPFACSSFQPPHLNLTLLHRSRRPQALTAFNARGPEASSTHNTPFDPIFSNTLSVYLQRLPSTSASQ